MNYIYRMVNLTNGKIYIGQTNNLKNRWYSHKSNTGKAVVDRAVNKHGAENFSYECIEICATLAEANLQESWHIMINNSLVPVGYNVELGGKNKLMTEETKAKISNSSKGKVVSSETRARLSRANKGKKLSDEQKKKLSLAKKGLIWRLIDGKRVWINKEIS